MVAPSVALSSSSSSPFDRGIQYAWDSTSLGWLKECPRKYYYYMVRGLVPARHAHDLEFGIVYHSALETFDKARSRGEDFQSAARLAVRSALVQSKHWDKPPPPKTREALIRSIVWYLEEFKSDQLETVILSNGVPAVELSFSFEVPVEVAGRPVVLCGHLDKIVRDYSGREFVLDRKTTRRTLAPSYFSQFNPDNQMSFYVIAGRVLYSRPITGVIIDATQVAVTFSRFSRGFVHRSEPSINEWLNDLRYWVNTSVRFVEASHWPMNDKACHNYGGCPFRLLCRSSPEVRENFISGNYIQNAWNPLEPRS